MPNDDELKENEIKEYEEDKQELFDYGYLDGKQVSDFENG